MFNFQCKDTQTSPVLTYTTLTTIIMGMFGGGEKVWQNVKSSVIQQTKTIQIIISYN